MSFEETYRSPGVIRGGLYVLWLPTYLGIERENSSVVYIDTNCTLTTWLLAVEDRLEFRFVSLSNTYYGTCCMYIHTYGGPERFYN